MDTDCSRGDSCNNGTCLGNIDFFIAAKISLIVVFNH